LLERRPDIAGAERRVATANAQIGVAQAAFYPAIALSATAGLGSSRAASLFSIPNWFWSFGPALAQTLFDAGRRRFTVEGAEAAYDVTVANYRQGVLAAFQEVEDNLAALRILEEEAQQQELATQSAQRSLDLVLNRYRAGVAIYTEVITAQNALLANQQSQIGIRTRRMAGTVLLIKALGGGWDRSELDIVH
jgi:NodT family efflux transporter outer membrane factor (OMF) lipoprotein